jgi:hypothetical protein
LWGGPDELDDVMKLPDGPLTSPMPKSLLLVIQLLQMIAVKLKGISIVPV